MKFRNKPVVIEAVQFTQDMHRGLTAWPEGVVWGYENGTPNGWAVVETLEGNMKVSIGDWIITGVKGEKYPCKPDVFAATYEEVVDNSNGLNCTIRVDDGPCGMLLPCPRHADKSKDQKCDSYWDGQQCELPENHADEKHRGVGHWWIVGKDSDKLEDDCGLEQQIREIRQAIANFACILFTDSQTKISPRVQAALDSLAKFTLPGSVVAGSLKRTCKSVCGGTPCVKDSGHLLYDGMHQNSKGVEWYPSKAEKRISTIAEVVMIYEEIQEKKTSEKRKVLFSHCHAGKCGKQMCICTCEGCDRVKNF